MSDSESVDIGPEDPQEELLTQEDSISDEDRREILADIEEVVQKSRIAVSEDLFRLKPQKNGFLLPTLINLLAIASVAAGFYFSARFFEARQESMNLEVNAISSAEGRLIEELKRESEARIAEKEAEINQIQAELARIENQSANLRQDFDSALARREAELQAELQAQLAAERNRLQALDITPEELEARLREYEIAKQDELQARLEEFRIQSQAELQAKEQELLQAREVAQQILNEANRDREAILEEAAEREAELASRFEEERQALEEASSEAEARLAEIARRQENEDLLNDQIIASYESIIERMSAEEFETALNEIESLRSLLDDPRIENLPRIAKRRDVERFILNSLEDEIEVELSAESADTAGLVEAAQRLFNARSLVEQAENALADGRDEDAQELYQNAISAVPSIQNAVDRLDEIEVRRGKQLSLQYISQGEEFLNQGNTTQALAAYKQAADAVAVKDGETLNTALNRFESTLREDTRTALSRENQAALNQLREEYEARIRELQAERGENAAALQAELSGSLARVEGLETEIALKDEEIRSMAMLIEEGRSLIEEYQEQAEAAEDEAGAIVAVPPAEIPGGSSRYTDEEIEAARAEYESRIEGLNRRLAEQQAELETDAGRIEELDNRLQEQQQKLESAITERKQLEEDLDAAVIELVDVVTRREGDDRYSSLARGYLNYRSELERNLGGSTPDYDRAENILRRFFDQSDVGELFPGLGGYVNEVAQVRAAESRAAGEIEGRRETLTEIERYSGLLINNRIDAADSLKRELSDEALYQRALEKIDQLNSRTESTPAARPGERFLGTVAGIEGRTVVIESLANLRPDRGSRFSIRRRSADGVEILLATGEVSAVSGAGVRGRIDEIIAEELPVRLIDLVYIEE